MSPDRDGPAALPVSDNADRHQLELVVEGHTAFLVYERRPTAFVIAHTEVPDALRGRRLGERLVRAALETARAEGRRIIVLCPFARAYLRRHPEVAPGIRIPPDE